MAIFLTILAQLGAQWKPINGEVATMNALFAAQQVFLQPRVPDDVANRLRGVRELE